MATRKKPAAAPPAPSAKKPAAAPPAPPAKKPAAAPPAPPARKPAAASPSRPAKMPEGKAAVSPEERYRMVAQAAYFIAERREFAGGDPVQDWLLAERQVEILLAGAKRARRRAPPKG